MFNKAYEVDIQYPTVVATHFEKITHFEKNFQRGLNLGPA